MNFFQAETSSSIDRNSSLPTKETELKLAKALSQVDHLKSQNDVLQLTLDDAKTTSEKLSIQLARHESNSTAMQLTLAYADQVIISLTFSTKMTTRWRAKRAKFHNFCVKILYLLENQLFCGKIQN